MGATVMDEVDRLRAALADRYELDREIGHGGMAHVYRAHDRHHGRDVAIKVLRPELTAAVGTERFLREIHFEARLQHPHILPLYDSGEADGLLYYVMPYVEGETLRDRIRREKQLPITDALHITKEVADALSYAHAHDVVHRDIKPANILLSGEHAVVADFGIAKAISSAGEEALTGTGIAIGTPEYMSPEQGSGEEGVDRRSDIYALGCVLYEMLAGQPPFTGRTVQGVLARHRNERPPPLRVVRPSLSAELEGAVERALAKVPADRFPSVTDFAEALEHARHDTTAPVAERPQAKPRPHWRLLAGLGAAVVAGVVVWRALAPAPRAPDPNKVMVFPLAAYGDTTAARLGEAVAIMIGSAFEHSEPLKWIDGWTWLTAEQRADARSLTGATARSLALRQGARYLVEGSILRGADSATIVLRLYDASGDSLVARVREAGRPDETSLLQLGMRATVGLMPALVQPGPGLDPTLAPQLAERRPDAIANWLQGEREYRRAQFGDALGHFRRAVEADSALALAAVHGAATAIWLEREEEAISLLNSALAHERSLPAKHVELARGLRSYSLGVSDSAIRHFQRALAMDSTWGLAWMGLGEVHFHLIVPGIRSDSAANAAFLLARRQDPSFSPALYHLAELALTRHDIAQARQFAREFHASVPDADRAFQLDLMISCADGERTDWQAAALRSPLEALLAAKWLSGTGAYPTCATQGFGAVLGSDSASRSERWGAVLGLQSVLVALGRYQEAVAVLDSANRSGVPEAMGLFVVDAAAGAPLEKRAEEVIASLAGDYPEMSSRRLWYHGIWESHRGDLGRVKAIAQALDNTARQSKEPDDRMRADAMAARASLLGGDTAGAINALRRLRPAAPSTSLMWSEWQTLAGERFMLAELLLRGGLAAEALEVAEGFDHPQPIMHLLYLPASLALRMEAARTLGDRAAMLRYRDRLLALGRRDVVNSAP